MNTLTTFRLAPWLRVVALSFLLGFALLVGNLLSLGTAHAKAALTCPKITGFSPTSGSAGVSVTVTGCGFTGATKVTFKGVSAIFTVISDTQITATVPSGAATGRIAVTTSSGTTVQSSSKFAVLKAPPAVTLSPSAGPPTSSVSVSGSNFGSYEAVDIYFDTSDEALAATNAQGAFSGASILVPASALPGTHWITAVGRHSGLSAQTAFTVQTNWAEFGDLPQLTRANQYENVLSPANVGSLNVDWSAATGAGIFSSPAVVNGVVYVGSEDNSLYAFNAQTGAQLWAAPTGGRIFSSPAVANGVVYVGSNDDHLYAFNAQTGAQLWAAPTGGGVNSSPAVANGVVYIGSQDRELHAFNAQTGVQLWAAVTGFPIQSAPAVANGVVYVGSSDGKLYAFNAQTGTQLWSDTTGGGVNSSPAVANGVVYIGSNDANLYAFNAQTGAQLWAAATGNVVDSSPAVANGVVYVGSEDHHLYAYTLPGNEQFRPAGRPNPANLHPNLKLHL